jgi:hypothetical protein
MLLDIVISKVSVFLKYILKNLFIFILFNYFSIFKLFLSDYIKINFKKYIILNKKYFLKNNYYKIVPSM